MTSRERVADQLGLPLEQVSDSLLAKIADDPTYLHHLYVCRSDPEMFKIVLREASHSSTDIPYGTGALMARAMSALARWAASGFERVEAEEYQRRLEICHSCKHLSAPSDRLAYKLLSPRGERSICGLCGCDVRRKAWLITERCPDRSTWKDGRWEAR